MARRRLTSRRSWVWLMTMRPAFPQHFVDRLPLHPAPGQIPGTRRCSAPSSSRRPPLPCRREARRCSLCCPPKLPRDHRRPIVEQPLLFPYFRSTSVSGAEAFICSAQIVTCPLPKAPQMGKSFSRLAMTQFIGHIQGGVAPIRCSSLSIFLDDSGVPRLDRNRLLWPCRHLSQQIRSRTVGVSETFWVAGIVEVVVEPLALSVHPVFHPDSCR